MLTPFAQLSLQVASGGGFASHREETISSQDIGPDCEFQPWVSIAYPRVFTRCGGGATSDIVLTSPLSNDIEKGEITARTAHFRHNWEGGSFGGVQKKPCGQALCPITTILPTKPKFEVQPKVTYWLSHLLSVELGGS